MKKTFPLLIAFSALAAGLVQPGFGQSQQPEDESSAARIARIENDLLPAVVIKGQAVRSMKLNERMQFYKVPGVSVAFCDLHDGGDRLVGGVTGEAADGYSGSVAQDATDGDLLLRSELIIGNFPRAQLVVHVLVQA